MYNSFRKKPTRPMSRARMTKEEREAQKSAMPDHPVNLAPKKVKLEGGLEVHTISPVRPRLESKK